jgi:hypothetical protein
MATTALNASGTTGTTCRLSGPYRSSRNARVIVFIPKGQPFPPDTDGAATTWSLITAA